MKILLIGPVHREEEFLKQTEKLTFLKGQAHQSYLETLEALGHTVTVFKYTDSYLVPNRIRISFNALLLRIAPQLFAKWRRFQDIFFYLIPDSYIKNVKLFNMCCENQFSYIFISSGSSSLFPQTFKKIKQIHSCKIFLLAGVNPEYASPKNEREMIRSGLIDLVIENDEGYAKNWKKIGAAKVIVLPISAVDPKIHKKINLSLAELKQYGSDVCFVGTLNADRQTILATLTRFNLKIWGDIPLGQKLDKCLEKYYCGQARGEKMVKIFNASKIVLNFQPKDMTTGGNMRTFEIPGCGSFQLADKADSRWFINNKEIVLFHNSQDLIQKIEYYLNHEKERKKIAENGYVRAHSEHTYKNRFKKILKFFDSTV